MDFEIGDLSPLHCSAVGKILLAYGDERMVEEVPAADLAPVAPNTITDPAALREEFVRIRAERCVAVPLFEAGGTVPGAIAISGPASRFDMRRLQALRDAMRGHADTLLTEPGGMPPRAWSPSLPSWRA